jgi:hypothetical protein
MQAALAGFVILDPRPPIRHPTLHREREMKIKHILACCILAALCLTGAQPAAAARIYNFTVKEIHVAGFNASSFLGGSIYKVSLAPGTRSDSLNWSLATSIDVYVSVLAFDSRGVAFYESRRLCYFNWWIDAKLQGGNYLVVSQSGRDVNCNLCNDSGQLIERSSGRLPEDVREYYSAYQMC